MAQTVLNGLSTFAIIVTDTWQNFPNPIPKADTAPLP